MTGLCPQGGAVFEPMKLYAVCLRTLVNVWLRHLPADPGGYALADEVELKEIVWPRSTYVMDPPMPRRSTSARN